jgi:transcriptional regulator with XRE-family HTH domain
VRHESILDFVLRGIESHRGNWREVSKVTGVPYSAISKLAQKQHPNPRLDKLEKLARYFRRAA